MPLTPEGLWVPNLSKKQFEIFNTTARYVLVSGPRKASKTWGVAHRVVRHAWETDNARIGIYARTVKNALSGGFDALYRQIVPEWAANLDGFEVTKPLSTHGTTRLTYFRIATRNGAESEFQLHSLDKETELEEKVKGTEFSCIWITELTNFTDRAVFDMTQLQLRGLGVPYDQQLWIADTNPDEEDGDQFWAYKIWYEERLQEDHPFPTFQKQLHLIETTIEDNVFLDPREVADLKASYAGNKDLYDIYVLGKWVQTSSSSLLADAFSSTRHIIGGEEDLVPEDDCTQLFVGWDPGDRNMAVHILEKVQRGGVFFWKVLDELVIIGQDTPLSEFSVMVCEMMDDWEDRMGKKYQWIHWSDMQSIDRFRSSSGTYDSQVIYQATGGRVHLEGVPKYTGSQRMRVQLMRHLLLSGRIFISGNRCQALIASLRGGLKRGKTKATYLRDNTHKHPFDSATYPIQAESSFDVTFSDKYTPSSIATARI